MLKSVKLKNTVELIVQVKESKYEFLLDLLKEFDFVNVLENKKAKKEAQKKVLQERFINAYKEAKLIAEGKIEGRLLSDVLAELDDNVIEETIN